MCKSEVFENVINEAILNKKKILLVFSNVSSYKSLNFDPTKFEISGGLIKIKLENAVKYISLEDVVEINISD